MKNIVFSILHYQAFEMTCECVEALMCLETEQDVKISIVIVDNNSPNESGQALKEKYASTENIYVIEAHSNLGFAKGNNLGYDYAKHNLNPTLIVVINNDVIIDQCDFLDVLICKTGKTDVLAPDIVNLHGIHQNPMRQEPMSDKEINLLLLYGTINKAIMRVPVVSRIFLSIIKLVRNKKNEEKNESWKSEQSDIVPHGSAVVFCEKYIANEDNAFIPDTFMFCEEDILYDYLKEKGYKILYTPTLRVTHYEDVSTDISLKNEIEKRIFMFSHKVDSLGVLKHRRMETKP